VTDLEQLAGLALDEAAGNAILLDDELRVVLATPGAEGLVGARLSPGERAVHVLCGQADKRPVADALARGQPISAELVRPSPEGELVIRIRSVPLTEGDKTRGHLLFLSLVRPAHSGETDEWGILTVSESMRQLLRDVRRVARTDASVLIRGETGSGKELIARALHQQSRRAAGPFRAINCAALPAPLLESELFGHVRGAFTGAVRDAEGHFRLASGGTLFLDEVAEMPLELQAKMLRVLQERTVLPVGGREPVPINVRLVAATHRSLRRAVQDGRFRADLMYRLRVIPLYLPPLRERPADIALLAERFVEEHNARGGDRQVERISKGAMDALVHWEFPGNVRELQNVIEYAFVLGEGPVITEAELPLDLRVDGPAVNEPEAPVSGPLPAEAKRIQRALERAGGSREQAAASLGMSRTTLWRKLKQFGLAST
jgi:transcriptional regulator with PAS, ATPase and Fis domain